MSEPTLKKFQVTSMQDSNKGRTNRAGIFAVVAILGLGLLATFTAYQWQRRTRQNALAFWGYDAGVKIRSATKVTLGALPSGWRPGAGLSIENEHDISDKPGLLHARGSLLEDGGIEWTNAGEDCPEKWTDELVFHSTAGENVSIALDLSCGKLLYVEGGKTAKLGDQRTKAWKKFLRNEK